MSKRILLFLILIVPVYYVICFVILAAIALVFPPNMLAQAAVFLPLYLISSAGVTSYIIRNQVIPQHLQVAQLHKRCLFGTGLLNLCAVGLFATLVYTGVATPVEAFVASALLVVLVLWLLIKRRWMLPAQDA